MQTYVLSLKGDYEALVSSLLFRVIHSKGREYDEYGFCITGPDDGTLEAKASFLQKQSQALAHQIQVVLEAYTHIYTHTHTYIQEKCVLLFVIVCIFWLVFVFIFLPLFVFLFILSPFFMFPPIFFLLIL